MKISVIIKKELTDQIRDKRTIIAAILMPAVIVPMLLVLILPSESDEELHRPAKIVMTDDDYIEKIIRESCGKCEFINPDSPAADMLNGSADLQIQIIKSGEEYRSITIYYDPVRSISLNSYIRINSLLKSGFAAKETSLNNIRINSSTIRSDEVNKTILTLALILPVFLMLFSASSAMSGAIDMSAGEKERSTIEIILSCSISHAEIILGKMLAASVIGFSSVASLIAGLALSSHFYPQITGGISLLKFCGIADIVLIMMMTGVTVLIFASAGMVIGLFAKSVKEGTILTLPVIILSSALSSGIIAGDPYSINKTYMLIPVLNFSCLIRSVIFKHHEIIMIGTAFLVNMACVSLFLFISGYLLKKESAVFRS